MTADATSYRADIDGLRAIAVLAVMLFHVDPQWLPGGFVGVDVFFVVSGYLITRNLTNAHARGTLRFAAFYAGRVRRLAPSLLLVLGCTVLLSQWFYRPADALAVAESALWSLASAANFYFHLRVDHGYFAPASDEAPLLHLWSLGIEEQFYLLWPLALLGVLHCRSVLRQAAITAAACLACFGLGVWLTEDYADFAYYQLPTRASGLLLGATLALVSLHKLPRLVAEAAALIGIGALSASIWAIDATTAYPGWHVAVPCIGTALLLAAGAHSRAHIPRLLAVLPLRQVGQVSYAAYLWHWPVLAFYRYGYGEIPSVTIGLLLFGTALLLAFATTHWFEQPLRRQPRSNAATFRRYLVLPGAALSIAAVAILLSDGYGARRLSPTLVQKMDAAREQTRAVGNYASVCEGLPLTAQHLRAARCIVGTPNATAPTALLWGDSHAAHYVGAVDRIAAAAGYRVRNLAHQGCPPLLADPGNAALPQFRAQCRQSLTLVWAELDHYDVILLAASWQSYQYRQRDFRARFRATVDELSRRGKRVVVLGRIPVMLGIDRLCLEKAVHYPGLECSDRRRAIGKDVAVTNAWLRSLTREVPQLRYFDANHLLCDGGTCSMRARTGELLFFDRNHLSMAGSELLGERVLQTLGVPDALRLETLWPTAVPTRGAPAASG